MAKLFSRITAVVTLLLSISSVQALTCDILSMDSDDIIVKYKNAARSIVIPVNSTFPVGTRAVFKCKRDLFLVGKSRRRCKSNGRWSPAAPVCEIRCPQNFNSASVRGVIDDDNCQDGWCTPTTYTDVVCKTSTKHIEGATVTCKSDGTWKRNGKQCTKILCGDLFGVGAIPSETITAKMKTHDFNPEQCDSDNNCVAGLEVAATRCSSTNKMAIFLFTNTSEPIYFRWNDDQYYYSETSTSLCNSDGQFTQLGVKFRSNEFVQGFQLEVDIRSNIGSAISTFQVAAVTSCNEPTISDKDPYNWPGSSYYTGYDDGESKGKKDAAAGYDYQNECDDDAPNDNDYRKGHSQGYREGYDNYGF